MAHPLIDSFGRTLDYVRLSVTDRCNFRCLYCVAEQVKFLPRAQLLTLEELARLGRCFSQLGVAHLRVTGGEPLLRRRVLWLFEQLGALPGLEDLTLTTNGSQLRRFAAGLRAAGVHRVNVSLDSLRADRFARLTRGGCLRATLDGVDAALAAGFRRVKLNTVAMAGINADETVDLVRFALARGLDISFIEEMPFAGATREDGIAGVYSSAAIRRDLARVFELHPTGERTAGPARYDRVVGTATRIGFISPRSHAFCADCNRLRVTPEGRLLLCLGQTDSLDLRRLLRAHPDDDEPIREALLRAVRLKPRGHGFDRAIPVVPGRPMHATGG